MNPVSLSITKSLSLAGGQRRDWDVNNEEEDVEGSGKFYSRGFDFCVDFSNNDKIASLTFIDRIGGVVVSWLIIVFCSLFTESPNM